MLRLSVDSHCLSYSVLIDDDSILCLPFKKSAARQTNRLRSIHLSVCLLVSDLSCIGVRICACMYVWVRVCV